VVAVLWDAGWAFGAAEAKNALNGFTGVFVRFDPKTAGEADIRLLTAEVEKVAKLKVDAADDRDQRDPRWQSAGAGLRSVRAGGKSDNHQTTAPDHPIAGAPTPPMRM